MLWLQRTRDKVYFVVYYATFSVSPENCGAVFGLTVASLVHLGNVIVAPSLPVYLPQRGENRDQS